MGNLCKYKIIGYKVNIQTSNTLGHPSRQVQFFQQPASNTPAMGGGGRAPLHSCCLVDYNTYILVNHI